MEVAMNEIYAMLYDRTQELLRHCTSDDVRLLDLLDLLDTLERLLAGLPESVWSVRDAHQDTV
jgi:hypothetical protein